MTRSTMQSSVALAAILLSGCQRELTTLPDLTQSTSPTQAMTGVSYNLPMLQYDIEIAQTLSRCPTDVFIGDEKITYVDPSLNFDVKVSAKQSYVRGETYIVDYTSLASPIKTSDFAIEIYRPSGNLKSINVSAADQSGELIKSVVKFGVSVAALGAGVPPTQKLSGERRQDNSRTQAASSNLQRSILKAVRESMSEKQFIGCAPAAKAALATMDESETIEAATKALNDSTTQVKTLLVLTQIAGLSPEKKGAYAEALQKALNEQDKATADLKLLVEARTEAMKQLGATMRRIWPERLSDRHANFAVAAGMEDQFRKILFVRTAGNVIDRKMLANKLAELRQESPEEFDAILAREEFRPLSAFLEANGTARTFAAPSPACIDARGVDVVRCLRATLGLSASLVTVELNDGRYIGGDCPPNAFPTLDCRSAPGVSPTIAVQGAKPASIRVVEARSTDAIGKGGLFVRDPVAGRLFMCRVANSRGSAGNSDPDPGNGSAGGKSPCDLNGGVNLLASDAAAAPTIAPQLGQLRFLPFKNKAFQSNELVLELAEDGAITKFQYKDKVSTAVAAATAAADAAQQIRDEKERQRKAAAAAETQSVTSLQAEIDLLTKRQALLALQKPADDVAAAAAIKRETDNLTAETALLDAKLAKLKAERDFAAETRGVGK